MEKHAFHSRRAYRRTDDYTPGKPRVVVVEETLPNPLPATSVLIKVHAVSLNYRDANISNGGNPWPVIPHGIICNDAAGEVVALGSQVTDIALGDRVAPIIDTENLTGREAKRSWLAADEDGVLADYIVFDQKVLCKLPDHLDWTEASLIPCAGVTAWTALKDVEIGKTVLIQGTGGVAMFALKLARAAGLRIILSSSSDRKLEDARKLFGQPSILTVNYANVPDWHETVLKHTDGAGVDLVLEVGGATSLIKSMKCTRRGGIISQVGYLSKQDSAGVSELLPLIIDRRVKWRGINGGSKIDMDDLIAAINATRMRFDDIIDTVYPFSQADEAVDFIWQGKQIGKVVIQVS